MKNLLRIVLLLIAVLFAVVVTRPATFHVERSTTIEAPAEIIQEQIADFHKWEKWSPWGKLDPAMKTEYSGAAAGVGAVYFWSGNDQVGEGRMTVTESTPGSKVGIRLEFLKPFKADNVTTFTLAPEGTGTKVTWGMDGNHDLMGKAFSLFMNMDKTVGGDFERGLASLKEVSVDAAAAAGAAAPADTTQATVAP